MSVTMWCLKICLVIFVLLHSQNGSTFDGFSMRGEAFDRRKKEAEWLDGVSMECNTTVRSLDTDARWLCKLVPSIIYSGYSLYCSEVTYGVKAQCKSFVGRFEINITVYASRI